MNLVSTKTLCSKFGMNRAGALKYLDAAGVTPRRTTGGKHAFHFWGRGRGFPADRV